MNHDHDIRTGKQRLTVAGLLVPSISIVFLVDVDLQAQFLGDSHGFIAAMVIDQDLDIHDVGELPDGFLQRLLRVIRGHDHDDALSVDHLVFSGSDAPVAL